MHIDGLRDEVFWYTSSFWQIDFCHVSVTSLFLTSLRLVFPLSTRRQSLYTDINRSQKTIFFVFSRSEEIPQVHEDRETMKKGKSVQIARPVRKIITSPRETETGDDPLLAQIQEKSAKVSWT